MAMIRVPSWDDGFATTDTSILRDWRSGISIMRVKFSPGRGAVLLLALPTFLWLTAASRRLVLLLTLSVMTLPTPVDC